ncbi:MAG: YceI family protein [Gemmatimonadaceae bacterium]
MVSRVSGSFRTRSGSITVGDPARRETAVIDVRLQAASIDTQDR